MSSIRTDPVALDTNEFIFALRDLQPQSVVLVRERLPLLHIFVPLQVQIELQHNLMPVEMKEFFDAVSGARQVDWGYEPAGGTLLGHYLSLNVKKGDARICAQLHAAGVRWLISENRHFLGGIPHLPFTVLSAADALVELE